MRSGAILDVGLACGGGAAAAFVDAKFPDKKLGPLGPGAIIAVAGVGIGIALSGKGGRMGKMLAEVGSGAAAFEVGKMVANKVAGGATAGVRGVRGIAGVRGMPGLPTGRRPLTPEESQAVFENLRRAS